MVLTLVLASCSKNESVDRRADLLAYVPDNATLTLAFSPAAILKSAGVEVKSDGLTLSKPIERLLSSNSRVYEAVKLIASAKGVDYNCAVIAGGTTDGCVLFALENASKFISWAKDNGMNVDAGENYTVCYIDEGDPAIVIDGLTAWFLGASDKEKALSVVEKCKTAAAENKLADWKLPILTMGDADLIIDMKSYTEELSSVLANAGMTGLSGMYSDMYPDNQLYSSADFTFDGPTLRISGEMYDNNGKVTPFIPEGTYTPLSKDILNLLKGSQFAFAFSIPEAYKTMMMSIIAQEIYGMSPEQNETVGSLVSSIHNAAFGMSMNENAAIMTFKPNDASATLALNLDKPEFAKAVSTLMAGIPDPQITEAIKAWTDNTSTTMHPIPGAPDFGITFCGSGDFAIASTDKATAETKINQSSLTDYIAYIKIALPKSHPLPALVSCPFGIDAEGVTTVMSSECHVTLTDTDAPFLEAILNFASRF